MSASCTVKAETPKTIRKSELRPAGRVRSRTRCPDARGTEGTVAIAPSDDALRQRGTDARQTCEFGHSGMIDGDALAGGEWASQRSSTTGRFMERLAG